MIKKSLALLALIYSTSVYAQSAKQCASSAEIAEASAVLMESGQSEEYVMGILTDPEGLDPKIPKVRQKIIMDKQVAIAKYVFTMRPSPADARTNVYAKCMAGGLGHTDWSKHPTAARAK